MFRYAATIFLSAFLLFQVQPLIANSILPWFGGSPSVWTTCMLFFQVVLLGGYCYAHLASAKLDQRTQALVHTALLVASLALLPILPDQSWRPSGGEDPTLRILLLLLVTIGLPYFLLSSTGPLVQRWFSVAAPQRSPYRLYSLSNIGSVLALLSFPFLFEPVLTGAALAWIWSSLFLLFALLCTVTAWRTVLLAEQTPETAVPQTKGERVGVVRVAGWLGLAALPSVMLLAVTNVLCQDISSVPFLWVAPLTVYLLTFILCFDSDRWYKRGLFPPLLGIVAPAALVMTHLVENNVHGFATALPTQIAVLSTLLFLCGMTCHGELVRTKPGAGQLTVFYVCVSAGGAMGGIFVALIAPLLFASYVELWLAAAACTVVAFYGLWRLAKQREKSGLPSRRLVHWALPAFMTAALCGALTLRVTDKQPNLILQSRSFFGRLRVSEGLNLESDGGDRATALRTRSIMHGHILHGVQIMNGRRREEPTTYYSMGSGVGLTMRFLQAMVAPQRAATSEPVRIGVIGLGAGTLAAYGARGVEMRFYEIQPDVIDAAEHNFTFLSDARSRGATVTTVLGDARIQLERELARHYSPRFDLLVVDAFSSDAIPKHLLTKECNAIYWKCLRPDGLLAIHITNRYLDLLPVVRGLAQDAQKQWMLFKRGRELERVVFRSNWVVVTSNKTFLSARTAKDNAAPVQAAAADPILWTDDFSSLWHVLR